MPLRMLAPRTGYLIVAILFLILAPETVHAQPATHLAAFKVDASRSVVILDNQLPSVGPQNVLVTVCVTTGAGAIVTVAGAPLFWGGLGSPPFDSRWRRRNIQVTRTIAVGGATGHVEGTYTVSTNLK